MGKRRYSSRNGACLGDTEAGAILSTLFGAKEAGEAKKHQPVEAPVEIKSLDMQAVSRPKNPPPPRPPSKKKKKEQLGFKKSEAEKIYAREGLLAPAKPIEPADLSRSAKADFGERHFETLRAMQITGNGFTAETHCEGYPSPRDVALIGERLRLGAQEALGMVDEQADGYIGYDMGTSATKVAVRWPYDSQTPAFAVSVPESWQSGQSPHLWPTAVFFNAESGEFSLLPRPEFQRIEGFKAGVLSGSGHRMTQGFTISYSEATTAFVAMHAAYVLGAIRQRYPQAKVSNFNCAVPVVAVKRESAHFEKILAAAMKLVPVADRLTISLVRQAAENSESPTMPFEIHAELVGAIAGYQASPSRRYGPHMLIDCGSATLDIVTFTDRQNVEEMPAWAASVETLGADAIRAYRNAGRASDVCLGAINYQEHRVCMRTRAHRRDGTAFSQANGVYPYQVIVTGGGIDSPLHSDWLERIEQHFQSRFVRPELGDLACETGCKNERLIIADGLARDPFDLRKLTLPDPETIDTNQLDASALHDPSAYH